MVVQGNPGSQSCSCVCRNVHFMGTHMHLYLLNNAEFVDGGPMTTHNKFWRSRNGWKPTVVGQKPTTQNHCPKNYNITASSRLKIQSPYIKMPSTSRKWHCPSLKAKILVVSSMKHMPILMLLKVSILRFVQFMP